jgi:hypothetical protein
MAGSGLAIALSYLALERFRYRRDVEEVAIKLHEKYENDAVLSDEDTLEHLNELKWLCRKSCNGHQPSGFLIGLYGCMFRSHGDIFIVSGLAVICAVALVVGTAGAANLISEITQRWVILAAFFAALAAMILPAAAIVMGLRCKRCGIARAILCDRQVALMLTMAARKAELTPPEHGPHAATVASKGSRRDKTGFWLGLLGRG